MNTFGSRFGTKIIMLNLSLMEKKEASIISFTKLKKMESLVSQLVPLNQVNFLSNGMKQSDIVNLIFPFLTSQST